MTYSKLILYQEYAVGSKVLLKNMTNSHRMGGKLDATWKGPYTVAEFVGKGRYRLKRADGKELKKLYNGVLFKEYIPSSSQPAEPSGAEIAQPRKKRKVLLASLISCISE